MNFFKLSSLPLRKSVLLISTAILISTTAQAEIKIGRLPSFHAGSGQVVGVKPNVFLVIDNNELMTGSPRQLKFDSNGSYLQQTSAALIASLPKLEGKVRLGYTTVFRGFDTFYLRFKNPAYRCSNLKLSGNVNRLQKLADDGVAPELKNIKKDLESNSNYVTAHDDFVFGPWGSGVGETTPRDFRDNYARYIYSWLGAICPGSPSPKDKEMPYSNMPASYPPYADLKDRDAYIQAAEAAGNRYSFPTFNFAPSNIFSSRANSLFDPFTRVLGEVSDERFLCSLMKSYRGGSRCGYTNLSAERGSPAGVTLRQFPGIGNFSFFKYDAYAPARADNGYPDDKNPLSCRKNYTIMIAKDIGSFPDQLESNSNVGITHLRQANNAYDWEMGDGRNFPTTGRLGEITKMYRHLTMDPPSNASFLKIPREFSNTSAGAKFMISKLALQTYYLDLRSNLPNDVPPFYGAKGRRPGPDGRQIPRFWDRKNDTAPWQHITFFTLGFEDAFPAWAKSRIYNKNFPDLKYPKEELKKPIDERNPEEGALEAYFRAIETGLIERDNAPLYDWSRGGFGLKTINSQQTNRYFYKNPTDQQLETIEISPPDITGGNPTIRDNLIRGGALTQMDYAKAGMVGRGGSYLISDYDSIKTVISMIADRIETAMEQGISGGAVSGGGRITASQQATGGNDSILFTTYLDQENASGNIFAFKNCPLIKQMIYEDGNLKKNPDWAKHNCGKRLWNAASALYDGRKDIEGKTIIPIKDGDKLKGEVFSWENINKDAELKEEFNKLLDGKNGGDALGEARVKWLNGTLQSELDETVANELRIRGTIFVPDENQRFKRKEDGTLEKDSSGNVVLADPTNITNLMGDVVYALPKAVDNRSTLPAAHPLNDETYSNFVKTVVKNRHPLVLTGANDGRFYGFSVADDDKNAELAFSFIPRTVVTKKGSNNLVDYTTESGIADIKNGNADGLVNGPFTVRDVKLNGNWSTYVVGSLGEGGDAIFALDISSGKASTNMFKWEVSGRGYGHIMAEPRIVWLRSKTDVNGEPTGKWVVIVPTGYNADSVSLVILDLADGTEIAKIDTMAKYHDGGSTPEGNKICSLNEPSNKETNKVWNKLSDLGDVYLPPLRSSSSSLSELSCDNGLGQLTVFDADSDSGADFVFAGDLFGHVWKFDLRDALDPLGQFQPKDILKEKLKVAYNSPLFIAQTPDNPSNAQKSTRQPITTMITIDDGAYGEGSMLYFGTGRMFNQEERSRLEQQQSFYGVWDIPRYNCEDDDKCNSNSYPFSLPLRRNPPSNAKYDFLHYETFNIPTSKIADNKSSLKYYKEIRGLKRTDKLDSSKFLSFNLKGEQSNSDDKAVGWIIDFPAENAIERVLNRAYSFEDNIFFSSFSPKGGSDGESCQPIRSGVGGDARFYMVDRLTGKQLEKSPFDFNNDGTQDDEKGKDGVKVEPNQLGKNGDLKKLGYEKDVDKDCKDNNDPEYNCEEGTLSLSPASIMIGTGTGDFLSVTGVLERSKQATDKHNCDYNRQIIFPSTADPITGNPKVLTSCNRNRYRVWKQPAIE